MIILDIDNCIADDEWRIPRIEWQFPVPLDRYRVYHELAPFDQCYNKHLFVGEEAIIMTARPVMYRVATEEWLRRSGVNPVHILMRNNNDHRSSLAVKTQQLGWLLSGAYPVTKDQITKCYDDRADIVRMYRYFGLDAEVAFIHQTSAFKNPTTGEEK